jgi:hypothetical protein
MGAVSGLRPTGDSTRRAEQLNRVDVDGLGDALEAPEGQVALTALKAAHVGAMYADDLGESFLGQASLHAVEPQVRTHDALEITFHSSPRFRGATCRSTDL